MRSSKSSILDASLRILRTPDGPSLSLESVAREAGLSKPGLMYHFPTKRALVEGIVSHVTDHWAGMLAAHLPDPAQATPAERIAAYVDVAMEGGLDRSHARVFLDSAFSDALHRVWFERVGQWVQIPADLPADKRGRLLAAFFAADGYWFAVVTGAFRPLGNDAADLRAILDSLIDEGS